MKKLFIVFGFIVAFGNINAQQQKNNDDKKKKKIDELFDINLGAGLSTITGSSGSAIVGGQMGIGTNVYSVNKDFSINAGILGSLQGAKYTGYSYSPTDTSYYPPSTSTKETLRLFYLGIPIVAKYKFGGGFFAEAGLQPSFLLSAKYKANGSTSDYKDNLNTFDLGIPIGAGYYFSKHLFVGVRVIPGVTNISKNGGSGYGYNKSQHNFLGIARVGYAF
ncbi:MAG: PorT family protein [Bacteroidetes bacterium]|nr:PorT family protein [Bacteroidota bacterium]